MEYQIKLKSDKKWSVLIIWQSVAKQTYLTLFFNFGWMHTVCMSRVHEEFWVLSSTSMPHTKGNTLAQLMTYCDFSFLHSSVTRSQQNRTWLFCTFWLRSVKRSILRSSSSQMSLNMLTAPARVSLSTSAVKHGRVLLYQPASQFTAFN